MEETKDQADEVSLPHLDPNRVVLDVNQDEDQDEEQLASDDESKDEESEGTTQYEDSFIELESPKSQELKIDYMTPILNKSKGRRASLDPLFEEARRQSRTFVGKGSRAAWLGMMGDAFAEDPLLGPPRPNLQGESPKPKLSTKSPDPHSPKDPPDGSNVNSDQTKKKGSKVPKKISKTKRQPMIGSTTSSTTTVIGTETISGISHQIRARPKVKVEEIKILDKYSRSNLTMDEKTAFIKVATGYVLAKSNKLAVPSLKPDADGKLSEVHNLQTQLKQLKEHLIKYDMYDVFQIVVPVDVAKSPQIYTKTFDLFEDYPKLNVDMVANSCTWFNTWVEADYIAENMTYSLELIKNNCTDSLWLKQWETHGEFHIAQRGGPLMLFLVLNKIQSSSETALDTLKEQLKALVISKLPGENVEDAVAFIKSAYSALQSASTSDHCYVPEDFPKTVLKIMQTSSVPEFNQTFADEQKDVQVQSAKRGLKPAWPDVYETCNLALAEYDRLKLDNAWCVTTKQGKSALNASNMTFVCWNCGGNHLLSKCDQPRDEAKIEAARKAFKARRSGRQGKKGKWDDKGRPLKLNKKGAYVVDTKRWKKLKDKKEKKSSPPAGTPTPKSEVSPEAQKAHMSSLLSNMTKAKESGDDDVYQEHHNALQATVASLFSG